MIDILVPNGRRPVKAGIHLSASPAIRLIVDVIRRAMWHGSNAFGCGRPRGWRFGSAARLLVFLATCQVGFGGGLAAANGDGINRAFRHPLPNIGEQPSRVIPAPGTPKLFLALVLAQQDEGARRNAPGWTFGHTLIAAGLAAVAAFVAAACVIALGKRGPPRELPEREGALEKRYRDLVESANDIVYTHDLNGQITSFNPAGARITGYSPEEVLQMNISQLVAPDQLELAREMTSRKLRGEPATIYELDLISKQGGRVTVEISSRPIVQDGKTIGIQGFARDVTEREQAQKILVESEERNRAILAAALDCVITIDHRGQIIEFNPAAERTFGYARDQALGKSMAELIISPSLREAHSQGLARYLEGGQSRVLGQRVEMSALRADGTEFPVELAITRIGSDDPPVFTGFIRDISERRRAETRAAALSILGQSLSLATTAEEAAWIVADTADKLLGWDACYMHLLTHDHQGVIPVLNYDIVDGKRTSVPRIRVDLKTAPMDRKVIEEGAQLVLRRTLAEPVPGLVTFGDTDRLSASLMFVPIRHRMKVVGTLSIQSYQPNAYDREALNILQTLADLCAGAMDRIQAVTALRESEERFSKAFLMSPIPINISTLKEGRYLNVNDSLLRLLGFSREEVIGRTSVELGIWADPAERARLVHRVMADRSVRDMEIKVRRKSGEMRTVLASFELIHLESETCLIGISYDVTERLHLEGQLRQAQKMEAVGQLAAGIAHDFNNIMTIIHGYTSLVRSTAQYGPEVEEALQQVSTAADRAANLTRQLLTFSRRQVLQLRSVDLDDVVGRITGMLGRILGEHIAVECEYAPRLPAIQADVGMIEQLITNLAVNARDAMPGGGQLTISTATVEIDAVGAKKNPEARPGRFVCLTVSDTGCGMESVTMAKLFEPFFTTKEVGKGTGLGLATVYGIVKQHQAWIEVSSEVGKGSVFKVFFPALGAPSTEKSVATERDQPVSGGSETVLVVEDEPALRRLARQILQRYGYKVLEAESGAKALAIWREHFQEIDLLLTDVVMPDGMNGRELAERLKKEKEPLRVIYTSGYSLEVLGDDFVARTGAVLLPKPYQPATLARIVRKSLDGARHSV
jgi:two-component system cell cycle sensor histidine kinase/response regulator CckA